MYIPHYCIGTKGNKIFKLDSNYQLLETNVKSRNVSRVVLLDRDGVIISKAKPHQYIENPIQVKLIASSKIAIKQLNNKKIPIVIVSNQRGIYRKKMDHKDFYKTNIEMLNQLGDCRIEAIIYCPHGSSQACTCRKPKTGMIDLARKIYQAPDHKTTLFGDSLSDIESGVKANIQVGYIATKNDEYDKHSKAIKEKFPKTPRYDDLNEAIDSIFSGF